MIVMMAVLAAEEGGHAVNELPIPPVGFALLAASLFALALLSTIAFRNIGHRNSPRAYIPRGGQH